MIQITFPGLLLLLFIGLKLTGQITWSWWWVMSPFWIPAAIAILFFVVAMLIAIIVGK